MISATVVIQAQFYDLDPMGMVWHGHYARFMEVARCALLDHIGYNYQQMSASGYVWPIVEMTIKYVRPVRFQQQIQVIATLVEYENRAKIDYRITDYVTGQVITKARTTQVAVEEASGELQLVCPEVFLQSVRQVLS